MIVEYSCNFTTLNDMNFWTNSDIINTNTNTNTNTKLNECTNDNEYSEHEFRKRFKIKSNRLNRLNYNLLQDNKRNQRDDR